MALIPLKDSIDIKRVKLDSNGNPLIDAWGNPTYELPVTYACRIDESTKLVRDQRGYEVVSNTQILLSEITEVSYEDELTYTDANGYVQAKKPISITRMKDLSKVIFTRVDL